MTVLNKDGLEAAMRFVRRGSTNTAITSLQDEAAQVRAIVSGSITAYLAALPVVGQEPVAALCEKCGGDGHNEHGNCSSCGGVGWVQIEPGDPYRSSAPPSPDSIREGALREAATIARHIQSQWAAGGNTAEAEAAGGIAYVLEHMLPSPTLPAITEESGGVVDRGEAHLASALLVDADLLEAWEAFELGQEVPGPLHHAKVAARLRAAATRLAASPKQSGSAVSETDRLREEAEPRT